MLPGEVAGILVESSFQSAAPVAFVASSSPHLAPSFTPSLPPHPAAPPPAERPLITHETTYTYTTTRTIDGIESTTTRKETITNYQVDSITRPTVPSLIVTKFIRLPGHLSNDRASHARSFNDDTNNPPALDNNHSHLFMSSSPDDVIVDSIENSHLFKQPVHSISISPTPVTYYTTFTYFTTELSEGHPVVYSREQVISTIIRGKILPTRINRHTLPSHSVSSSHESVRGDRSKRSTQLNETGDVKINEMNNNTHHSNESTSQGELTQG